MQAYTDFMRYLRFTDGLSPSDIIGWILAAIAGVVAYKLIDHMQTSIERHSMLSSVEDEITGIFNSVTALSFDKNDEWPEDGIINDKNRVMVRSVLHDNTPWQVIRDDNGSIECRIVGNQRYLHIRNDDKYNEWISTQALHEIELKARRIEKMFKSGIVKRVDLADLFREIVPLATSGRIEFFRAYYGDYDAECIGYLVMQTIVSCYNYKNYEIINEFAEYYLEHPDIHYLFIKGRRIRKFEDMSSVNKFGKIIESQRKK
ncbi:MAG: hypothetical protein K5894_06425 [Lachnospiraceae bacterium]|nr:hypothetical protein [Lachnospiraceae bacterium]